jgi:hypothetical protein
MNLLQSCKKDKPLNLNSKSLAKRAKLSKNLSQVAWLDVKAYKKQERNSKP